MTEEAFELAETIWKFMQAGDTPVAADFMLVFGTNDLRVATLAAEFYRDGLAPLVITTGGIAHHGDLLATPWDRPEAVIFAEEMIRCGVPEERILIEPHATNTAENVRFARAVIDARPGPPPRNAVAVVKPFMQRRVQATMAVHWPELPYTLASWDSTFAGYSTPDLPPGKVLNIMLGDLQRLWVYAERGWSAPQPIPDAVRLAFDRLVELGYRDHLLRDAT
jgi:uncharacterized SAM-binding protein YcdF (DUF218 family)